MKDFSIWQGGRLDLQVVTDLGEAVSATIVLINSDGEEFEFTEPFVDLVADFQDVEGIAELPAGVYEYRVEENYASGLPEIFPDPNNCDGECELPTITICEAGQDS